LRPIVLGRKNYLFAGSEAAAHRTAILCSLVQTCKHLQINPFVYLRDVIDRVSTHPARLVLELTPRESLVQVRKEIRSSGESYARDKQEELFIERAALVGLGAEEAGVSVAGRAQIRTDGPWGRVS